MSLIESILYGLISGLTDFLPVSSRAHQALMRYLFGVDTRIPLQEFLVHIGILISVTVGCRDSITRLRREHKQISASGRRRHRSLDSKSYFDLRLLKTAAFPLFIGSVLLFVTVKLESNLLMLMTFWLLNAFFLLLADHTRRGNRDSRTMSALDGIIMGVLGVFSVFPGISRTGMISAYTTARGCDSENSANWSVLLAIPAMLFFICFDLISMITNGFGGGTASIVFGCFLSGAAAFAGGYMGISLFKVLLKHSGFTKFAYYTIGAALISFFLFLIT